MKQFSYVLTQEGALHARLMSSLLREAAKFQSRVRLADGEKTAALSESHALSGLNMRCGNRITVQAEGWDEEAAIAALQDYFVANL